MDKVIIEAQKRLEEKRERLVVSQPMQNTGENQSSLSIEDKERIKNYVCTEHGYLEPGYQRSETFGVWIQLCPTCAANREAENAKKEEEEEKRKKNENIKRLMGRLQIGRRFVGMTFDDYVPVCNEAEKVKSTCQRYAETFNERRQAGDSLIFLGACGTGKNMLAAILCQEIVNQECTAVHTTIFKMIRAIKDSWRKDSEKTEEQIISSFSDPELLVIDEVGVQFGSETEKLYLTEIINNRYERRLPTIIISNLNLEELESVLGTRIIDRFYEGKGAILKFTWESYRRRSR